MFGKLRGFYECNKEKIIVAIVFIPLILGPITVELGKHVEGVISHEFIVITNYLAMLCMLLSMIIILRILLVV